MSMQKKSLAILLALATASAALQNIRRFIVSLPWLSCCVKPSKVLACCK